ncbi:MAG: hypothetical protein AAFR96_06550 [Planctomycetota bacterium]
MIERLKTPVCIRAAVIVAVMSGSIGCANNGDRRDGGRDGEPQPLSIAEQNRLAQDAVSLLRDATRSEDAQTRANAYESLVLRPEELAEVAGQGLLDPNLGVRSVASMSIGRAKISGFDAELAVLLKDESPYVQAAAVYALAALGRQVDQTRLADFARRGDPVQLRGHAAYLLGELGEPTAVGPLRTALREPMPMASQAERRLVELQISEAMIKLGDLEQLGPVRAALYPSQPSDLEAMALAVQIVGEVNDRAARGRLVQISESTDDSGQTMPAEIQLAIAISMARLGDPGGWFLAEGLWASDRDVVRADAATVLGWTARPQDIDRLGVMLSDPSERVRVAAARGVLRALDRRAGSG